MKPYILSLKDCYDRRQILEKTMIQNGMKKWEMCIFDKVENSNIRFNGTSEDIPLGILSSHLCTIKKWYEESDDDYGLFFEDDVSFESKKHWNFDLVDFTSRLPGDWSAIQLCGIYQVKPDIRLRERDHIDHGLQAYVLTRSFAEKLISETFAFDKSINITKPYISSSVENIVLNPKYGKVYTFPLFNHNIFDFKSTSIEYDNKNFTDGQSHLAIASYNEISNWWAEKGCKLSLEEILEL
jgi:GR25 family glycosyltransferase involved in LPS biosynthesis